MQRRRPPGSKSKLSLVKSDELEPEAQPSVKLFNPCVDYQMLLASLRHEFQIKWDEVYVSPQTGLTGYEPFTVLGSGAFGQVRLVKETATSRYYAVKEMLKETIVRSDQVLHVMNEKRVLYSIKFPFNVGLEFSAKDNDCLYLGMPFINGGELFTYHRRVRKFNEKQARFYAAQVFLALEYLHECQLLYRDLKPENIMLDDFGYIKLTDFGFAKRVETRTMTLCGTPEYLAPEIILSKPYGTSVDWWAFGVLVYEFVDGASPFYQYSRDVLMMYSKICEGDFPLPKSFSPPLQNLILGLLDIDRSKRLGNLGGGAIDIKEHEWFKTVNWYSVLNREISAPYKPYIANMEDLSNFERVPHRKSFKKSPTNQYEEIFVDF